jgi:hypothetical protein
VRRARYPRNSGHRRGWPRDGAAERKDICFEAIVRIVSRTQKSVVSGSPHSPIPIQSQECRDRRGRSCSAALPGARKARRRLGLMLTGGLTSGGASRLGRRCRAVGAVGILIRRYCWPVGWPLARAHRAAALSVLVRGELVVVPEHVVHPVLLGGWWLRSPSPRRKPDEVAR